MTKAKNQKKKGSHVLKKVREEEGEVRIKERKKSSRVLKKVREEEGSGQKEREESGMYVPLFTDEEDRTEA